MLNRLEIALGGLVVALALTIALVVQSGSLQEARKEAKEYRTRLADEQAAHEALRAAYKELETRRADVLKKDRAAASKQTVLVERHREWADSRLPSDVADWVCEFTPCEPAPSGSSPGLPSSEPTGSQDKR